jgi:hypothetical protein
MGVYIVDKNGNELILIQEINDNPEKTIDLRLGVWDVVNKDKLIKKFPQGQLKKAIKFGELYAKKNYNYEKKLVKGGQKNDKKN